MKPSDSTQRAVILGALVADAAALGLHWLYDQDRVAALGGDTPEFTPTTAADFDGFPAYFAHAKKQTGDFTQYGEQAMVMLQSLAANNGAYQQSHYQDTFRAVFGYGGDYVGYIDHPTKDTLDNLVRADAAALAAAKALPFSGSASDQHTMITKVTANLKQFEGDALREAVERAVRISHDDDATVAYAHALTDALAGTADHHGANDQQLPAVAKLPPLIALFAGDPALAQHAESAVRVTNHNDQAVSAGHAAVQLIETAMTTQNLQAAVTAATNADTALSSLMTGAAERTTETTRDVIRDIGMSCQLVYGLPGAVHTLLNTGSFTDAVRTNILAGGDSCGRAMVIGAAAGAAYGIGEDNGIPQAWIDQLNRLDEVNALMDQLNLA